MLQLINSLNVLLPLVYGASFGLYTAYFFAHQKSLGVSASRVLLTGIILHLTLLVSHGLHYSFFPISTSFASMSMLALDIALIYYFVERIVKEGRTGIFFLGIVFCLQLISSMFIKIGGTTNELLSNPMFGIHTTLTILGISALAISAVYALMYIMLSKEMKKHRFGLMYKGLPSMEILESMARYATGTGIITLGIGIFLGHIWAWKVFGYFFQSDLKIIATDFAWIVYALGWLIVKVKNIGGYRVSLIALWGFILFFMSIVAINLLGFTFHQFV